MQDEIERYVRKKTRKDPFDPAVLDWICAAVTAQKAAYWNEEEKRTIRYRTPSSVIAYLAYQFPVNYAAWATIFAGLFGRRPPGHLSVLDIGCGPGTVALALIGVLDRMGGGTADVRAVERSRDHIDAYAAIVPQVAAAGGRVTVHPPVAADIRVPPAGIAGPFDLITCSNVLNELPEGDRAPLLQAYARLLSPGGLLVCIEPAEMRTASLLRRCALALHGNGLYIRAPCRFLRGTPCRAERCWSFVTHPPVAATRLMRHCAERGGSWRFCNTDVQYAYVVFAGQPVPSAYRVPERSGCIRCGDIGRHLHRYVSTEVTVVSDELGSPDTHVRKICDGTGREGVYAVMHGYHVRPANRWLLDAPYGSVVRITHALVRRNERHHAWNLLVTRDSEVVPVRPPAWPPLPGAADGEKTKD
ncbi:MAG: class I SAM-dependent methyltransferase [Methanomicrobiales archaeon]|nr:class I SAM-dependent methyltransferase [Methanomicrobiales archaeon]